MPPTVMTPLLTPVGELARPAGAAPPLGPALPPVVPPPLGRVWPEGPAVPEVPALPELPLPAAPGVATAPVSVWLPDWAVWVPPWVPALLAVRVAEEFRPSSYATAPPSPAVATKLAPMKLMAMRSRRSIVPSLHPGPLRASLMDMTDPGGAFLHLGAQKVGAP